MANLDLKLWGIRVRKALIVSLIAPFFTMISAVAPQPANAVFQTAGDGSCIQDVNTTTGVTVTVVGGDCVVTFTAPTNATTTNTWVVPSNGSNFQILVVGGGGGGGADGGNGGGGGELRYSAASPSWIPSAGTTLSIQVGGGGGLGAGGAASTVAWGGTTRYQANPGAGGGGWQSTTVPAGGSGGSGGTGTNGQSATASPPVNNCTGTMSATRQPSSASWFSNLWFLNGGGGAGGALATTAPSNSITGTSRFYGGAGGAGWGANINSASTGPIFGLPGGGTVDNTSTSGGRGANWLYEAGESTTYRGGASVGANGVNGRGGGGGAGAACDPTINGTAVTNLTFKRTNGGVGGAGTVVIRYTPLIFTVSFDANGGSGSPSVASASQTPTSNSVTLASVGTLSRTGFRFAGWNTQANGLGVNYAAGSTFTPSSNISLYAQWNSTIQYAPNTATTTRAIESTTAVGSSANTTLSAGQLVKGSPISNGLVLHLDASDASTVSGSSWTNKVAGVSGAEAAATLVGSPTYNASEGAFSLNGSSQFFTLGTTNYLFNGALPFTLNLSFKASDPNKDNCLIGNFNGGVGATHMFRLQNSVLVANRNVSPWQVTGTGQIPAGEIVYASYSFDGSYMRVYLNGSLYVTSALINNSVSYNGGARIGACQDNSASSRFFKGQIYNAQIYNRALSGTEITTNFDNLVPGRLVSKDNYTLGGWNTQSNGTGTSFGSISSDLAALPTPFFRVSAENYSGGTLSASVGGSNLSITKNGNPVLNTNSGGGFGANARFPTISGATGDGFRLGNAEIPNYTFCGMARYKDLDSGVRSTRGRIFAHSSLVNWISGWYDGGTRNFFHDAWLVGPTSVADPNWHVVCDSGNRVFWDGVKQTVTQQVYTSLPPLAINWAGSGDNSHFEFTEAIVYNQALSDAEINTIFRYFENKFGLTNITTSASSATKFVPPSDYSSQGDTTLQATWVSRVTYDGNRQTSGVAPSTQTITNTGATVAGVGTLARSGFIFAGWNTAADGSGTRFAPGAALSNDGNKLLYAQWVIPVTLAAGAIDPATLNPYMRLVASDYDATNKVWRDSSGNSRNVTRVIGSPTLVTTTGNGATKSFQTIAGGTADKFYFDNDPISTNWTVFALSRYSGANNRARIISGNYAAGAYQDSSGNWLFGHWDGKAALAHYNGWVTAASTPAGLNLTDWVMSTAYPSNYRYNGIVRGTSGGTSQLPPLGINTLTGEQSDYQVAEVIIFNRTLTLSEIGQVEDYFDERYGLAYSKVGSYQTANTLAIGAGVGGRSETFTATNGLGTKTFSMSPSRSGMTLDTSTANSVVLVVSPVAATGTYTQTITATDLAGETSTHVITVTVSPSVKFDTSTATTLITTHRRGTTLRLNTVFGVGSKVFTMTPVATGISLDTSTAASGFATLRVDTFTATGTYTQVITVTDDTRVRSTYTITILINAPPTISSTSAIVTSPILDSLRLNLDAGDPASYSGSGTSWTDLSGSGKNATWLVSPTFTTEKGGSFTHAGGTNQYATTPNLGIIDVVTVEAWVKFNTLNTGNNYPCVITDHWSGSLINYSICFAGNNEIKGGYWRNGWTYTSGFTPVVGTWYHLVYTISKSGSNYISSLYQNGSLVGTPTTATMVPANSGGVTYLGRRWDAAEYVNGQIPIYRVDNRPLSATEVSQNYNALLPRFSNNPSNVITITTTESVTAFSSVFYAGLGTGNKTFAISNATTGISIDTSTVNTVRVNLANTLTATSTTVARSISQVITATDTSGIAAATPVYVTTVINPKVIVTASTPITLTTTFGRVAYDTFTATQGTGNKIFTGAASSYGSAFAISNPSTNVGLLTVANNLPIGTYTFTATATDSVGATTNYILTVIVNPAPTIAGATGNTLTTTLARSATLRINVLGGTGTRTIAWTSPQAGITLDTSTLAAQNFITLTASAAVPVRTYSFSISATDSSSARVSDTFTVIVNRWPVIGSDSVVQNGLAVNLDASTYSGSGNWLDSSGFGRNASGATASTTPVGTAPEYSTESGGIFSFNEGAATTNHMLIPNPGSLETFTVSTWVRFKSIPTNNTAIITQYWPGGSNTINYVLAFSGSSIYGAYYRGNSGWTSASTFFTPQTNTWYHLSYSVFKSGSNYFHDLYVNGVKQGSSVDAGTIAPTSNGSVISLGRRWDFNATAVLNGAYGNVSIYNRALSASEILQNYNATGARYIATNSGRETVTVTQGVVGTISNVLATQGTGTKTFAITNVNAGVTIDTSTANAFTLNLANTLTSSSTTVARTITETVTATDAAGASTARVYTITVNPPIIETATSTSIATTSGVETTTIIYATQGTGNKTFTLSGASSGFTLTSATNQATLRVLSTANPGTYDLNVTATDALGATTALPITVVVSPPPNLLGISRIESTRGVAFTSPIYNLSGGTGALSVTVVNSPTNSNITLTGTTSSGTYLQVGADSPVGTYLSTIRVTDARGSYSEIAVTVVVNAPVTLSGALSITKTYGNSTTNGYSTNGTGTAPFSFSATPVCAVVKTVSGSYTYERVNGTDACTWTAPVGVATVDALLVGAGGGGGADGGAGGGGGSINTLTSVTLPANRQLSVQVGAGGSGGIFAGSNATAGGTTSVTSGSTTFTAPGGAAGGGCGAAASAGGVIGSGGTALAGGAGGFGATGTGCTNGSGSNGSNGPSSSFTGSAVNYGGGGGGGPYPSSLTSVGPTSGGSGGGGTGAVSKASAAFGLQTYFRSSTSALGNANLKQSFYTGLCANVVGNINYTTDNDFPCSGKDYFQGFATGYFIAPVSGSITFFLSSDDSSYLTININGTDNNLELNPCCKTVSTTMTGFTAGQAYPINVWFTEDLGGANWILSYSYTGVSQTPIPMSQFRTDVGGLAQYFRTSTSQPGSALLKQEFTTGTCSQRVGAIAYTTDSEFPCAQKDNFQGYATGFFIAPITGSIKFYLNSDDSSLMSITVNGTTQEFSTSIGDTNATFSGFVQGQYYPIKVFFTEIAGSAVWKLDYEYSGQARTSIPISNLRSLAEFTAPTQGTNGLGGGGGGGSAGLFKISGAAGGSGTVYLKYLTATETATETMITAIVNQQSPSGLLTLNVPAYVNVGTYFETITVQDAVNSAPYQAVVTITINKATPSLALSLPGSVTSAKYGSPVTISATSPIPGRVAFINGSDTITACSNVLANLGLATCSWTPTVVGSTTLRAILTPTDTANYNSSSLVSLAVTVAKADTLTVTVLSQTETFTGTTIVANRAFTTTGLAAIDSLTAISMLFTGTANDGNAYSSTTAPTNAGTYLIAPNYPANASAFTFAVGSAGTTSAITNYESVTVVSGTLTVRRAPQTMVFTYPDSNTVTYSPTATLASTATTRLGLGTRTYSSTTPITCSISETAVVTVLQAGTCSVQMAVALTANYDADTATRVITINKASRTFTLTPGVSTLKYADTTTVTATLSGGAADGTISYTLGSPAGCTLDPLSGELVAISGTIQCPLTATISEGINYLAETSTAISLTIARANAPVITLDTVTALNHTPGVRAQIMPTFTIAGLKNLDTADALTYTYSFISNPFETFTYSDTRTPIDAGTYRITPSALTLSSGLMSNYETPTYSSSAINFVINRIAQETVTIQSVNGEVDVPFTLIATGGSTTGAITFAKVSGANCSVTGTTLTATQAGSCMVTVTRAGDRNYLPFTSESVTVRVRNFVMVQIYVPENPITGITITPSVPLTKGPDTCSTGCVPRITSADVYDVAEGDLIVLTGVSFSGVTKVYFNIYTEAPNFNVDSDTQISLRVPADLPLGDATIEVVSPGGTSNRLFDFIILP